MTDRATSPTAGAWEDAVRWLRDQPGAEALVRDAYYDDPIEAAAHRYWRSEEWAAVRPLLGTSNGRALDVGAGRGIASYALARDGFEVVALEPDPSALVGAASIRALSRRCSLQIDVNEAASEHLPFADGAFDVVFARAALHHIGDLPAAVREFRRVLKPNGRLVAIREHVVSHDEDLPAFLAAHPLHHRYGGEHAYRLCVYVSALTDAGFRLRQVITPLESPVNFAPHSLSDVSREIAQRICPLPLLSQLAAAAVRTPGAGDLLRKLAAWVDHRPGRHFSFVAERPTDR